MNLNIPCRSIPMPYYVNEPVGPDYSTMPLTLQNTGTGSVTFRRTTRGGATAINLQYKIDDGQWTNLGTSQVTIPVSSKVQLSGNNTVISPGGDNVSNYFTMTGSSGVLVYGNINSLVTDSQGNFGTGKYGYNGMFMNCTPITDASNLVLPSGQTVDRAYVDMFKGCTYLTAAPQFYTMSATMSGIQSLACNIFSGCTSLVKAPKFSFVDMWTNPFTIAFANCTNLKVGPLLDCPSYVGNKDTYYCFLEMFRGCTSLSALEVTFNSWAPSDGFTNWMQNVPNTSNCLFIKPQGLSVDRTKIPSNWTVLNRIGNNLFYAQQGDGTNVPYTGDDPYAEYYN